MSDLETDDSFNKLHNEDVIPSKIVDSNAVIIDRIKDEEKTEDIKTKKDDPYHIMFIISIVIAITFVIAIISKYVIKLIKKENY